MTVITNTENLWENKMRFPLSVEQILGFAPSSNVVREVKYKCKFQFQTQIACE